MPFKDKLAEKTGIPVEKLPSSYQIIGDVLLLKLMKIKSAHQKKKIADAVISLLPYVKTVCEIAGVEGELREPKIMKLAGNGTETVHKEHGILYKLDVSKVMFSKGNKTERQRLKEQAKSTETIIDMFAGIGYFSLPLAKKCKKVIAIEKNPAAFKYLKENIALNKISNIEPVMGDNRVVSEKFAGIADRVLMGYFQTTRRTQLDVPKVRHFVGASVSSVEFLPYALKMLKQKGMIHFHNTYHKTELWEKPLEDIKKYCKNFKILNKKKVKSVAPNTYHVVLDVEVTKR